MKAYITTATPNRIKMLIPFKEQMSILESEKENFERCLVQSSDLWVCMVDEKMICFWGLAPPTLLSDSAYLWLYTVEAMKGHEFIFIRQSQIAVEEMLKLYPTITGCTDRHRKKSIRWLKWLGAEYGYPEGDEIPFTIHRRDH